MWSCSLTRFFVDFGGVKFLSKEMGCAAKVAQPISFLFGFSGVMRVGCSLSIISAISLSKSTSISTIIITVCSIVASFNSCVVCTKCLRIKVLKDCVEVTLLPLTAGLPL